MGKIRKYNMCLEVITPLYIGGVDYNTKLNSNEYLYNPNLKTLTLIDNQEFVKFLIQRNLFDLYLEYIEKNTFHKKNRQDKKVNLFSFLKQTNLDKSIDNFKKKEYKNITINSKNKNAINDILLFNRNSFGRPYIAGSSIKGAIVNSLLVDYIVNNRKEFKEDIDYIMEETKKINQTDFFDNKKILNYKKLIKTRIASIQNSILYETIGKRNQIKKFGLSISDTYESEDIVSSFLQDIDIKLEENNKEEYMPVLREYIMPKSLFYFDITIDVSIFEKKNKLNIQSIEDVINSIKRASMYLTSEVIDTEYEEEDLILGANTGFHQKTIIHSLFEDKNQRNNVVKRLIHTQFNRNKKDNNAKMKNHSNDIISPRVLNKVKYDGKTEIAGLVNISKIGEKTC